jgi:hypothetical protein
MTASSAEPDGPAESNGSNGRRSAKAKLLRNGVYADVLERWDVIDGAVDLVSINANR